MLQRRGASSENIDAMGLLQTLCLVKMDSVDGKRSTSGKPPVKADGQSAAQSRAAANERRSTALPAGSNHTEMKGEIRETQAQYIQSLVHLRRLSTIR